MSTIDKCCEEMKLAEGGYYLPDLKFSTRNEILVLKNKDKYTGLVAMKQQMKLSEEEVDFVLFSS